MKPTKGKELQLENLKDKLILKKYKKNTIKIAINMRRSNIFFNITSYKGNTLQQFSCANFGVKNSRKKKPIIRYDIAYTFGQRLKLNKIDRVNLCFTNRARGYKRILVAFRRTKIKINSITKANFKPHNGCPIRSKRRVGRGRKKRILRGRYRLIRYKKARTRNKTIAGLRIQLKTSVKHPTNLKFRSVIRKNPKKKLLGPTTTNKLREFRPKFILRKRFRSRCAVKKRNKKISIIPLTTKIKRTYQKTQKTLYFVDQKSTRFKKTIKKFAIRWKGRWRILKNIINKVPPRGIFLKLEKKKFLQKQENKGRTWVKRLKKNMRIKKKKTKNMRIKKKIRRLQLKTKIRYLLKPKKKKRASSKKKRASSKKKPLRKNFYRKILTKLFSRNVFVTNINNRTSSSKAKFLNEERRKLLTYYKNRLERLRFYRRRVHFRKLFSQRDVKRAYEVNYQRVWSSRLKIKKTKQLDQKIKSSALLAAEKGYSIKIDFKKHGIPESLRKWLPLKRYREERRKWWRDRRRIRRRIRRAEERKRKNRLIARKTTGISWKTNTSKTKKVSG